MPVYEYICKVCKKSFEVFRAVAQHEKKAETCPKCRSRKIERHWSSVFVETSKKS
jgi:putative FmdB family regulatory protein